MTFARSALQRLAMRTFLTLPWRGRVGIAVDARDARRGGVTSLNSGSVRCGETSPHPARAFHARRPTSELGSSRTPPGEGKSGTHPCQSFPDLRALIHSALTLTHRIGGWASRCLFFRTKTGCDVRFLKRGGSSFKLPTLRFRAKIMLGFAVVLAISAASMGFAYLGFERVSAVVDYLPPQRAGGRPVARHRSRTDLLSLARPLFRGDRKGRGRQGGAGSRNRPEGRDHCLDEGNHQPDAAGAGRRSWNGNSAPSPRFSPTSSRSRTRARASRKTSSRAPATRCATSSTISRAMPMMTKCR